MSLISQGPVGNGKWDSEENGLKREAIDSAG